MGLASQTRKWGASEPRRPGAFAGDSFDALTSVMYFFLRNDLIQHTVTSPFI